MTRRGAAAAFTAFFAAGPAAAQDLAPAVPAPALVFLTG